MKTYLIIFNILLLCVTASAQSIRRDTVHFDFDLYTLKPDAKASLTALLKYVSATPGCKMSITGHTDSKGSDEYNVILAKNRVNIVRQFLLQNGIKEDQIVVNSFGELKPIVINSGKQNRARNRRVEIVAGMPQTHREPLAKKDQGVEPPENDTIIYGEDGTEIEIKAGAFCDKKIKDMKYKLRESLSKGKMIVDDLAPRTAGGGCLISGGMVFMSATTADGEPIQPCKPNMITFRIPVQEDLTASEPGRKVYQSPDTAMRVYQSLDTAGPYVWKRLDNPMKITEKKGRKFYESIVSTFTNYNCDHPPANVVELAAAVTQKTLALPLAIIRSIVDIPRNFLEEKECLVVKSRKHRYSRSYMVSDEIVSFSKGKLFRKNKKAKFECDDCFQSQKIYVGIFKKGEQYYYVRKPLAELKYRSFFNRYIVRNRDYKALSPDEIEKALLAFK